MRTLCVLPIATKQNLHFAGARLVEYSLYFEGVDRPSPSLQRGGTRSFYGQHLTQLRLITVLVRFYFSPATQPIAACLAWDCFRDSLRR